MNKPIATNSKSGYFEASKYLVMVLTIYCVGGILLFTNTGRYPELLGMGVLSYTFGLRHAFDADHIAAIDNMTCKLIQEGKKTKGVGFFFSLGHSTVVIVMGILTIFAVKWAEKALPQFQTLGGAVATLFSGGFLIILATINFFILKDIITTFKRMRHGDYNENIEEKSNNGFIGALIKRLFNVVNKNFHVYIVGFLFGLGFDTATQIAVLATSATAANKGVPWVAILSFPILFTAGMSTMDTLDGLFMSTAYKWVFSSPLRKVYYNLTITGLSILAAGVIGIIEVFQVIAQESNLNSGFWLWLQNLDFNIMGYILVIMFVIVWSVSFIGWKVLRLGEKEANYKSL
ncbi:HoxN/HupN/NixA family nickel/cobalt transporter [Clostridium akagii]|uniref:HoxN/HupN/NixA family nickel/cobalt transporter n=1 Tax=Clostridium akagii TaxID=91623 RepID=UPI00047E38D0|nr:HoxN/HupN/NixA family nickel/cobalt transporter [Clostridium akagii]